MKTIEEKAYAYSAPWGALKPTISAAYLAGAKEALASQWRSAEDEPEHREVAFIVDKYDEFYVAIYNGIYKLWESVETEKTIDYVKSWMPIPKLNNEKR